MPIHTLNLSYYQTQFTHIYIISSNDCDFYFSYINGKFDVFWIGMVFGTEIIDSKWCKIIKYNDQFVYDDEYNKAVEISKYKPYFDLVLQKAIKFIFLL